MIWLVLGLALWAGAHSFKRLAPKARAGLGEGGRGMIAAALVIALVLMVVGYRMTPLQPLWSLGPWAWHLNNALMLLAVLLFGLSHSRSRLRARLRHPMLASVVLWAVAHLLVNGTVAGLVLFGGLGLWAVSEMVLINRARPKWQLKRTLSGRGDLIWIVASLLLFAVIVLLHGWLGPSPLPAMS